MKKNIVFAFLVSFCWSFAAQAELVREVGEASFSINSPREAEYRWTFPDGSQKTGSEVEYVFASPGEYPLVLTAREKGIENSSQNMVIVHKKGEPQAVPRVFINGERVWGDFFLVSPTDRVTFGSYSVGADGSRTSVKEVWRKQGRLLSVDSLSHAVRFRGPHRVELIATDLNNPKKYSKKEVTIVVEDRRPEILDVSIQPDPLEGYGKVGVSVLAKDYDGSIQEYRYELIENQQVVDVQILKTPLATFDLTRKSGAHQYSFRVSVTDEADHTVRLHSPEVFTVTGKDSQNASPEVVIEASPANIGHPGQEISFYARAEDADHDFLVYQWFVQDGEDSEFPRGDRVAHQFLREGTFMVRVEVSDSVVSVSDTIRVHILPEPKNTFAMSGVLREVLPEEKEASSVEEVPTEGTARVLDLPGLESPEAGVDRADPTVRENKLSYRRTKQELEYEIEFLIQEMRMVTSLGVRKRILREIGILKQELRERTPSSEKSAPSESISERP
mgnify:CR=1 FL=1